MSISNVHPMQTRFKSGIVKPTPVLSLVTSSAESEPSSFKEALSRNQWKATMIDEFNALISNNTWELGPTSAAHNLVASKWVFQIKYKYDQSLERYKARLVVAGNHQQVGIDLHETFAPVVRPATIRLVLSIKVTHNWPIRQLDIKNVFLHGLLTKNVYMCQPPDFVDPNFPTHVCHLKKTIYGLKQAPRVWFHRFSSFLLTQVCLIRPC